MNLHAKRMRLLPPPERPKKMKTSDLFARFFHFNALRSNFVCVTGDVARIDSRDLVDSRGASVKAQIKTWLTRALTRQGVDFSFLRGSLWARLRKSAARILCNVTLKLRVVKPRVNLPRVKLDYWKLLKSKIWTWRSIYELQGVVSGLWITVLCRKFYDHNKTLIRVFPGRAVGFGPFWEGDEFLKAVPKLTQDLNLIENTVFSIDYVKNCVFY